MNKFLALMSCISFVMPNIASAQQADGDMENILVSASLLPITINRSANAITIIDRNEINNRAVVSASDLLRDVAGLAVSRSGAQGSQTQIRMRGGEANHLLVLVDGVEANNPAQSDEFNWGTLVAAHIERIEIIRGPQSSILGSDAMAGVVNIITRSTDQPLSANAFFETGGFNTQNNGISIGFKDGGFDMRLGASDLQTDGENISRSGSEKDGYENTNLNLKSGWRASDQLRLTFVARQSDGMNEYDADSDFDSLIDDQDNVSKFRSATMQLKADYSSFNGHWQHQLSMAQSTNKNAEFNQRTPGTVTDSNKDQYRLVSSLLWDELNHRLSLLIEREEEEFQQRGPINDYGVFGIYDPNQTRSRETDSLALEYRADISEKLTLAVSTRHDDNSEFNSSDTSRVEAIYQINDSVRLRSAYGTAIKNPTFTERFGFYTNFIGNPSLEPEESSNWELGIDQLFNQGGSTLSVTFFNSELENEIDGNFMDPVTFRYTSKNRQGLSKRQGMELTTVNKLNDALSLNTSYTYTDSVEPDGANRLVDEVRRARHIGSLNLSWQAMDSLHINANAQYNGSQMDVVYPKNVKLADYTVVNLSANYRATPNLDVYVRFDNLLDESYEEVFSYQTLGFSANVGVRYKL
ncbi:TonB-dependent receptor [Gammaproteobacteria bacterium]|nr:TonB-dependent receptor [Gammaproteobacteria bacterium]MDB9700303.1 TonB-dependent receptor [Gammaproteobacteria bacterium]MDC1326306.1 TonB-dependent receptor [Gammaproteobacteria bacterium]